MPIKELRSKIKFLKSRVRRFMILSNYNWILWCVLQSKNPDVEFGHIKYAEMRLNLYTDQLKVQKLFKFHRMKSERCKRNPNLVTRTTKELPAQILTNKIDIKLLFLIINSYN